ncbi:MAG: protein phosphatase CheZ [Deltaproteobacteria bacterium]|nr:protein phosphatase CheZ [Deltaproteobacteria bacterium]
MPETEWSELLKRVKDELALLVKFVDKTRNGLDSIESTVKLSTEKFPEASRQIDLVAGELENAANNIITLLESMMLEQERTQYLIKSLSEWISSVSADNKDKASDAIGQLGAINIKLKKDLMEIFSNLSFQDLTGQKLRKVMTSLSSVETRLLELALTFDIVGDKGKVHKAKKDMLDVLSDAKKEEPMKLNQEVVDKILRELGA